ncbi:MAG: oligosaccharide repeat unit polymerase [Phycisphaerae bacterium]|nr:oligosaccharide repeat unit polymerase [Phycisphaerae bacterium]
MSTKALQEVFSGPDSACAQIRRVSAPSLTAPLLMSGAALVSLGGYSAGEGVFYGEAPGFVFFQFGLAILLMILPPAVRLLRCRDSFEPIYLFVGLYAIYYLVKMLDIHFNGTFRAEVNTGRTMMSRTLFLANMGILAFYAGYAMTLGGPCGTSPKGANDLKSRRRGTDILIIAALLAMAGLLGGAFIFVRKVTGAHDIGARGLWMRGMGAAMLATFCYPTSLVMWYCYGVRSGLSKRQHAFRTVVALLLLLPYLSLGSRGDFFIFFTAVVLLYHYSVKRISISYMLVIAVLFFAFSAVFVHVRGRHSNPDVTRSFISMRSARDFFHDSMRSFAGTEGFMMVLDSQFAKSHGIDYLHAGAIYVPSFIWPDKPRLGMGIRFTRHFYPGVYETGTTYGPSLLGAFYMDFGYWGISVGMFVIGWTLRRFYTWFMNHPERPDVRLIYAILMPAICLKAVSQSGSDMLGFLPALLLPIGAGIVGLVFLRSTVRIHSHAAH